MWLVSGCGWRVGKCERLPPRPPAPAVLLAQTKGRRKSVGERTAPLGRGEFMPITVHLSLLGVPLARSLS